MASDMLEDVLKCGNAYLVSQNDDDRKATVAAAYRFIHHLENPGEQMARIGWGEPTRSAAIRTAFELGIFTKLVNEPMSSAELAEGTKAAPVLVSRMMKHLAAYDIVKEVGKDSYIGTPFSMASNDPTINGGLVYSFEVMIPSIASLPQFLAKTNYKEPLDAHDGPIQYALGTEDTFFEYLQSTPRLGEAFNMFLMGYSKNHPRWWEYYPVDDRLIRGAEEGKSPFLVELGCGLGQETLDFYNKYRALPGQLVIEDLPKVIESATKASIFPASIIATSHDFFTSQPVSTCGARVYFLRLVLHDWSDENSRAILRHVKEAMKKDYSKILINETVLKDVGAPWEQTSLDWTMMGVLSSKERTETAWKDLLGSVGLKTTGIWYKDAESVIEAVIDG